MGRPIYVETRINASAADLWQLTQDPGCHQRWDLRFTRIGLLAGDPGSAAVRFGYTVRVLPGLTVGGTGVTVGESSRADGTRTSALRFASGDRLSLIRRGSGYWRYVPVDGSVRFLTGYQYTPGWGRFGHVADIAFRPLLGWATAWSFDRLRLWAERGISPERSLAYAWLDLGTRVAVVGAVAGIFSAGAAVLAAIAVVVLSPSPLTPAARRCRRRPLDSSAGRAPATLTTLEQP